jgi:hypothetical protein
LADTHCPKDNPLPLSISLTRVMINSPLEKILKLFLGMNKLLIAKKAPEIKRLTFLCIWFFGV